MLALAAPVLAWAEGGPKPRSCAIGGPTGLAGSCASGFTEPGYQNWRDYGEPSRMGKGWSQLSGSNQYTFQAFDYRSRMARVTGPGLPKDGLWVNARSLTCTGSAALESGGQGLLNSDYEGACQLYLGLPVSEQDFITKASTVNSELWLTVKKRASDYIAASDAKARKDHAAVVDPYLSASSASPSTTLETVSRAKDRLAKQYASLEPLFGPGCSCNPRDWAPTVDPVRGEKICTAAPALKPRELQIFVDRLERACRSTRDALALANRALAGEVNFRELARKSNEPDAPLDNDTLAVRSVLYFGADSKTRPPLAYQQTIKALRLEVEEVHNGYLMGSRPKGPDGKIQPGQELDCGGFAMAYVFNMRRTIVLKDQAGNDVPMPREIPSVDDFEILHDQIKGNGSSKISLAEYRSCFDVVDVDRGAPILQGDLVSSNGHIVVAGGPVGADGMLPTLEARSGQLGKIGSSALPVRETDCSASGKGVGAWLARSPLRSDLRALRPKSTAACREKFGLGP